MAVLMIRDQSGSKKFFAGFYRDNTIAWTSVERNALDKQLNELQAVARLAGLDKYNIRERIAETPTFQMP